MSGFLRNLVRRTLGEKSTAHPQAALPYTQPDTDIYRPVSDHGPLTPPEPPRSEHPSITKALPVAPHVDFTPSPVGHTVESLIPRPASAPVGEGFPSTAPIGPSDGVVSTPSVRAPVTRTTTSPRDPTMGKQARRALPPLVPEHTEYVERPSVPIYMPRPAGAHTDMPLGPPGTVAHYNRGPHNHAASDFAPPAFLRNDRLTESTEPTEVHIHIGRIEVTAMQETAPPPRKSRTRPQPMSLDQYLARRQQSRQ